MQKEEAIKVKKFGKRMKSYAQALGLQQNVNKKSETEVSGNGEGKNTKKDMNKSLKEVQKLEKQSMSCKTN